MEVYVEVNIEDHLDEVSDEVLLKAFGKRGLYVHQNAIQNLYEYLSTHPQMLPAELRSEIGKSIGRIL